MRNFQAVSNKVQRNEPSITNLLFQRFGVFHDMFQPTWPSSGNTNTVFITWRFH